MSGELAGVVQFFLKVILKSGLFMAMLFAFIVFLNFALSLTLVSMDANVLTDIFALIQIWLPFNLNVLLAWLVTATGLFFAYRMLNLGLAFINELFR